MARFARAARLDKLCFAAGGRQRRPRVSFDLLRSTIDGCVCEAGNLEELADIQLVQLSPSEAV